MLRNCSDSSDTYALLVLSRARGKIDACWQIFAGQTAVASTSENFLSKTYHKMDTKSEAFFILLVR
jgi:hypothetical protein